VKDNPTKLLLQTARKLYGTSNEELRTTPKVCLLPVAVLKAVEDLLEREPISMKVKTIAGDSALLRHLFT